jgi:hypothetical protein
MSVLTGNDYIYIMVALADWYILPILPQLGKLSGPSSIRGEGPTLLAVSRISRRQVELLVQLIYVVLSMGSAYTTTSTFSMDVSILPGCVIVGLQLQPATMAMSILRVSVDITQCNWHVLQSPDQ